MATVKISELFPVESLNSDDLIEVVQDGKNRKATIKDLVDGFTTNHRGLDIGKSGDSLGSEIFNDYESNKASGRYSSVRGHGNISKTDNQSIDGKFNAIKDAAYIFGNGDSDSCRSNAYELDWDGNSYQSGSAKASDFIFSNGDKVQSQLCCMNYVYDGTVIFDEPKIDGIDFDITYIDDWYKFSFKLAEPMPSDAKVDIFINNSIEHSIYLSNISYNTYTNGLIVGSTSLLKFLNGKSNIADRLEVIKLYSLDVEDRKNKLLVLDISKDRKSIDLYYSVDLYNITEDIGADIRINVNDVEVISDTFLPSKINSLFLFAQITDYNLFSSVGNRNDKFKLIINNIDISDILLYDTNMAGYKLSILGNPGILNCVLDSTYQYLLDTSSLRNNNLDFALMYTASDMNSGLFVLDEKYLGDNNRLDSCFIVRTHIADSIKTIDTSWLPDRVVSNPDWFSSFGQNGYIRNRICEILDWDEDIIPVFDVSIEFYDHSANLYSVSDYPIPLFETISMQKKYGLDIKFGNGKISSFDDLTPCYFFGSIVFGNVGLLIPSVALSIAVSTLIARLKLANAKRDYESGKISKSEYDNIKSECERTIADNDNLIASLNQYLDYDTDRPFIVMMPDSYEQNTINDCNLYILDNDGNLSDNNVCQISLFESKLPSSVKTIDPIWIPKVEWNSLSEDYKIENQPFSERYFGEVVVPALQPDMVDLPDNFSDSARYFKINDRYEILPIYYADSTTSGRFYTSYVNDYDGNLDAIIVCNSFKLTQFYNARNVSLIGYTDSDEFELYSGELIDAPKDLFGDGVEAYYIGNLALAGYSEYDTKETKLLTINILNNFSTGSTIRIKYIDSEFNGDPIGINFGFKYIQYQLTKLDNKFLNIVEDINKANNSDIITYKALTDYFNSHFESELSDSNKIVTFADLDSRIAELEAQISRLTNN